MRLTVIGVPAVAVEPSLMWTAPAVPVNVALSTLPLTQAVVNGPLALVPQWTLVVFHAVAPVREPPAVVPFALQNKVAAEACVHNATLGSAAPAAAIRRRIFVRPCEVDEPM